jgi:glycosyltransferase involved in cell wall biosynthesis
MVRAYFRARALSRRYDDVWERVVSDPGAVVHFGLNCSTLVPPDIPLVYECVDSTLSQLGTRHYVRAAGRRCVVHCQTERIRRALESTMASRAPVWYTVSSPCYFASYPDSAVTGEPRAPRAVFVGRLSEEKRPGLFIDAVAAVRRAGVDLRALLLGEGPFERTLRAQISRLGLGDAVSIRFSSRPLEALRDASIFVSLQSGDNYGSQSLLEAMGAGCAVVATGVGETGRLVTPETGLLVEPTVSSVAAALEALARDPGRIGRLGAAAARLVRTDYSADAYAAFLEHLYKKAVELHRPPERGDTALSA